MANPLKSIEEKYNVVSLQYNGEQIWPILRWYYFDQIRINQNNLKRKKKSKITYFNEFFYNWTKWLHSYDYLFYSDSDLSTRRKIDGKYFDRLMDPIINYLGKERCLLVEIPAPEHHSIKDTYTENIASYTLLDLKARMLAIFFSTPHLEDKTVLKSIQTEYGIKIDDEKIIRLYLVKKSLYKFLYKWLKVKTIFFDDSYRDPARLAAANELAIPTIDVQHGVIGQEHPAYNVYFKINDKFRCNYLFTFGNGEKRLKAPPFIYNSENIFPIGSYYLDYINKEYQIDPILKEHISRYKKSIAITLQKNLENELIEFISTSAKLDEKILYLLVPRQEMSFKSPLPNVELVNSPNFYELMKYVDFHVTVFSSTAIEAPSLGIPNILVDIDGYARQYYSKVLVDPRITRFVDTSEELVRTINEFKPASGAEIMESNREHVITGYAENLKRTLTAIGIT